MLSNPSLSESDLWMGGKADWALVPRGSSRMAVSSRTSRPGHRPGDSGAGRAAGANGRHRPRVIIVAGLFALQDDLKWPDLLIIPGEPALLRTPRPCCDAGCGQQASRPAPPGTAAFVCTGPRVRVLETASPAPEPRPSSPPGRVTTPALTHPQTSGRIRASATRQLLAGRAAIVPPWLA